MSLQQFLPFATGGGANVVDNAAYAALAARSTGFSAGIALSDELNKAWRQASVMAYIMGQFTSDTLGEDVLDDGDLAALLVQFNAALRIAAGSRNARIVTTSTPLAIALTDYAIGLNRTAGPAATAITLPDPDTNEGQSFVIDDLAGNLATYPATVTPPAGHTLAGLANFVMNEDRQHAEFRFFGSNLWGIE